jgi:hypothetical protein
MLRKRDVGEECEGRDAAITTSRMRACCAHVPQHFVLQTSVVWRERLFLKLKVPHFITAGACWRPPEFDFALKHYRFCQDLI